MTQGEIINYKKNETFKKLFWEKEKAYFSL